MDLTFAVYIESIFATLPRTQRGMPLVIKGDPKGKNILYCNGNSVIIRDLAVSTNKLLVFLFMRYLVFRIREYPTFILNIRFQHP